MPNSKTQTGPAHDGTSNNRQPRHSRPATDRKWSCDSEGASQTHLNSSRDPEHNPEQQHANTLRCSPPRNKIPTVEVPGGFPVFSPRAIARKSGAPPTGNRNEEASADDCDKADPAGTQCGICESQEEDAGAISEPHSEQWRRELECFSRSESERMRRLSVWKRSSGVVPFGFVNLRLLSPDC